MYVFIGRRIQDQSGVLIIISDPSPNWRFTTSGKAWEPFCGQPDFFWIITNTFVHGRAPRVADTK